MNKHYNDIELSSLNQIFPNKYFRLISSDFKKISYGISEIPVSIDLKKGFSKELSFKIPWDGELYGFVRNKSEIFKNIDSDKAVKLTISNWDNKFILIFEDEKGNPDKVFSVSKADIVKMLEECMKPPTL